MLHEHEEGRKYIKEMEIGIQKNDKRKVIENARNYARLLQEHIYKEDNILYPKTDKALDKKTKNEILEQFKQVNRKREKEIDKYLIFSKTL